MNTSEDVKIKGLSAQLLVADLDRSIDFYTQKLGFATDFYYKDFYAGIVKEGCTVHLKVAATSAEERKNRKQNGHLDLVFAVEGVDALYADIIAKDVAITKSLCDAPYGREFYIIDPDGYIIAFIE